MNKELSTRVERMLVNPITFGKSTFFKIMYLNGYVVCENFLYYDTERYTIFAKKGKQI